MYSHLLGRVKVAAQVLQIITLLQSSPFLLSLLFSFYLNHLWQTLVQKHHQ